MGFLDSVREFLEVETAFGDEGGFGAGGFLEGAELVVIASKFCAFLGEAGLDFVVGMLEGKLERYYRRYRRCTCWQTDLRLPLLFLQILKLSILGLHRRLDFGELFLSSCNIG